MGQKISINNTNTTVLNEHQKNLEQQFEVIPSNDSLDSIKESKERVKIDPIQLQSVKLKSVIQNKHAKIDHIQLRSIKLKPVIQNKRFKINHVLLRSIKLKPVKSKPIRPKPIQFKPICIKIDTIEEETETKNLKITKPARLQPEVPTMVRNETNNSYPKTMKEYYGVHKKKVKFSNNVSVKQIQSTKSIVKETPIVKETLIESHVNPNIDDTIEIVYELFLEKFSHLANNDKNKNIIHELCKISVSNMPDKVSNPTYYLNFIESSIKSIKQNNQNLDNLL
jgi:hypothetical protein